MFLGQFTVYTFISVLLLASGVGPAFLGPILLACGACGLLGLWFAGRGLDRNPRRTAVIVVALILGAVVVLGVTWPTVVAVVIATAIWSGAFGGVPSIYQACAVRAQAMPPELAGAWINSTANIGIAGGAAIGAGLLHTAGLASLAWPGALLMACGLAVILLSPKHFRVSLELGRIDQRLAFWQTSLENQRVEQGQRLRFGNPQSAAGPTLGGMPHGARRV